MKKLQKIFILLNERGFLLLEWIIALPLIVMLLWSFNNLFINSYDKCKFLIADFILQQEMESALSRIVEIARISYEFEDKNDVYTFKYKSMKNISHENGQYKYFKDEGKIYRGVSSGNSNPITGDSWQSNTIVTKFKCQQNGKLLHIRLEAKSTLSNHEIFLTTEVYMRGLQ